jgi:hypothetical protein
MSRHHGSLSEWVYGQRDRKEMADAIKQLVDIWPDQGSDPDSNTKNPKIVAEELDKPEPKSYVRTGTQHDNSPQNSGDDDPAACQRAGSESPFESGPRGGRLSSQPDLRAENAPSRIRKSGFEYANLDDIDPAMVEETIASLNWLVRKLASRGSRQGVAGEQQHSPPSDPHNHPPPAA